MSITLDQLLDYKDIVIQCHDNPDADAIASGYALWKYLNKNGIESRFIYSGKFEVQKSNLVKMIDSLGINIEYVTDIAKPELLVTVDCQYGESNVKKFPADNIAVIDHHQISGELPRMSDVRSNYGSCSTVMWELLKAEGYEINEDSDLATALYYGLYTDTNGFTEISRPEDKDLRDTALFRQSLITMYRNSNLTMKELKIAGDALKTASILNEYKAAFVEAMPCDPNILGVISDMLLEVDSVDTCLVYSVLEFGVKISVRSCIPEVQANELAGYIADGLGGGGGHIVKAGGFLKKDLIEKRGIEYTKESINAYFRDKLREYFENTIVLYAGKHKEDISQMDKYVKIPVSVGYIESTSVAPCGSRIIVRTLEGDIDIQVDEDTYIIIGIKGEIYPIKKEKFEKGYDYVDKPYSYSGDYEPTVIRSETGERVGILPYAKSCVVNGGVTIYARQISRRKKIFTSWDPDRYYLGNPGDYLATREDDLSDIYIIANDVFKKSYVQA